MIDHNATYITLNDKGKRYLGGHCLRHDMIKVLGISHNSLNEPVYHVQEGEVSAIHPMFVTVVRRKVRQYPIP